MFLEGFDFFPLTRVVFGVGAIGRLGDLARELGARRVLVVSDPGVVEAGHAGRGIESLRRASLDAALFDGVQENPTTRHVRDGVATARERAADLIVGLGGGSAMDCAKGINFVYSCGGEMKDYRGVGKAPRPLRPMIAVPTTAGTGSEVQSFALIADEESHQKMACGDRKAAFRVAILDPEVTVSQPRRVTAATGLDAIAHAVESFVTRKRNLLSRGLSLHAWKLLEGNFERVLDRPEDIQARAQMLLGAALAGCAIEYSMLGAAHSAANPLTARHGVIHGAAVGIVLPHVVRFNAAEVGYDYAELTRSASRCSAPTAEGLARRLEDLLEASGLATGFGTLEIGESELAGLAREAAAQWTARFNPRPVDDGSFADLYRAAFSGSRFKDRSCAP